jgi:hypothetical protein
MIRFFKRYFGFASFPAKSKSILKRALLAELAYFGVMTFLLYRLTWLREFTEARGGDRITSLSGGNWEGFLEGLWYPELIPLWHEMIFVWFAMSTAIVLVGLYFVKLDWRTGSEAHHRVMLHVFLWLNFLYPAVYIPTQHVRMAYIFPYAAMGLVLYFHMAKPTKVKF